MILLLLLAATPDAKVLAAVEAKLPKVIASIKDNGFQELVLRVTSDPKVVRAAAKELKCSVLVDSAKKSKPFSDACLHRALLFKPLAKKHAAAKCWTVDFDQPPGSLGRSAMVALEPGTNVIFGLWLFDDC